MKPKNILVSLRCGNNQRKRYLLQTALMILIVKMILGNCVPSVL